MKKINILIIAGLFVLLAAMAQPALAAVLGSWMPTVTSVRDSSAASPENDFLIKDLAQLNTAVSKFEGLLNAYSKNLGARGFAVKNPIVFAASDLSRALETFNADLNEIYPDLTEKEKLAVREAYSSLGSYLEDLATQANSILQKDEKSGLDEIFKVIGGLPSESGDSSFDLTWKDNRIDTGSLPENAEIESYFYTRQAKADLVSQKGETKPPAEYTGDRFPHITH